MSTSFYNKNAQQLAEVYLSKAFEQVHESWLEYLTPVLNTTDARILDLGAGAGRDSHYMAKHGATHNVSITAIEPAFMLAELGKKYTQGLNVKCLQDSLPDLTAVTKHEVSYDLILLSAVWMHIPDSQRQRSLRKLANLLKPGGKLVISLRHGPSGDEPGSEQRSMFDVCSDQQIQMGKTLGLSTLLETQLNEDVLGRTEVTWQTVVLQLPDDGGGAFPFIRHVANDGKSATHKLALMRVLLRIADGHPGAVIRREDNRVILPVGLVALYWAHQYKDLIDKHQLFQSPNKNINMGFMKANGWHQLTQLQVKRSTTEVRNRFDSFQKKNRHQHNCVWTDKSLKQQCAIDHCMPFSRWPNNDLWNLLPSEITANGQKSDRLPTETKMENAKQRITDWWQDAWVEGISTGYTHQIIGQRFFAEANITLPGLEVSNNSVDDLFEVLLLQRGRLKEMQQLREW